MGDAEGLTLEIHQWPAVLLLKAQMGKECLGAAGGENELTALVQEAGAEGVVLQRRRGEASRQVGRLTGVAVEMLQMVAGDAFVGVGAAGDLVQEHHGPDRLVPRRATAASSDVTRARGAKKTSSPAGGPWWPWPRPFQRPRHGAVIAVGRIQDGQKILDGARRTGEDADSGHLGPAFSPFSS